jgi:hypothetical protein
MSVLGHVWLRGEVRTGVFGGNPGERDHLQDLGVGGNNIKTNLQVAGWGGEEWSDLDQDRGRWWVLVNVVTKPPGSEFLD